MKTKLTNPAWEIHLKNFMRDAEQQAGDEQTETWNTIKEHVDDFLNNYSVSTKSLVLFVDENQLTSYELPITLDNASAFGEPLFTPLLWAIDEYERYLIVLVDQEKARLFTAYLGSANQQDEMTIDLDYDWGEKTLMPASTGDGRALREGDNRERFEDMIEEHVKRFYRDVAQQTANSLKDLDSTRVIFGGNERSAHFVRNELPQQVDEYVVDILAIPVDTTAHDLGDHIQQVALNYERAFEVDLVKEVVGFAKANGRGAVGQEAVDKAFDMQQVELLILPYPMDNQARAAELTLKALANNSNIELIHGSAADQLKQEGDIAARLYYAVQESS